MFRFRLSTLLIVVGVIAVIAAYWSHRYRIANESLTSLTVNARSYGDGREVRIQIAGNPLGQSAIVLVQHVATPNQEQLLANLKSELRLETHYPPDPPIHQRLVDRWPRARNW